MSVAGVDLGLRPLVLLLRAVDMPRGTFLAAGFPVRWGVGESLVLGWFGAIG